MISRELKSLFYQALRYPMRINGWLYRHWRAPRTGTVNVQLGPGQSNYLDGWINVDANLLTAKIDVWANLLDGLPFSDNSVDAFYSHHVIEHLPDKSLPFHFSEMYRCLKPGGVIRIGGPNGDSAIKKFAEGDSSWFEDFPDKRQSLGGRFANFIFCRGEHLTILTASYLEELAAEAGFSNIRFCKPITDTHHSDAFDSSVLAREYEATPDTPHTILVEAQKDSPADHQLRDAA